MSEIILSPLGIIAAIICAALFFIIDLYNEHKTREAHSSLIAGISITYFFLILLPEISEHSSEYPLDLKMLQYLFVLIGFSFIHIVEKIILQKVENKAQQKIKTLLGKEKNLDLVEFQIAHLIKENLKNEDLDNYTLRDMARILSDLVEREEMIKEEDFNLKSKIQTHINEDLDEIHQFMNFAYHFLVGLILIYLLFINFLTGLLFFFFAFFKAVITKTSNDVILFPDVPIQEDLKRPEALNYFLATAALSGVLLGLISATYFTFSLEALYGLFSFISGVLLYMIVREIIPEAEKGNPFYFLIGMLGFSFLIIIIKMLSHSIIIN